MNWGWVLFGLSLLAIILIGLWIKRKIDSYRNFISGISDYNTLIANVVIVKNVIKAVMNAISQGPTQAPVVAQVQGALADLGQGADPMSASILQKILEAAKGNGLTQPWVNGVLSSYLTSVADRLKPYLSSMVGSGVVASEAELFLKHYICG